MMTPLIPMREITRAMLFDTHCHLFSKNFHNRIDQVLLAAQKNNIGGISCIAVGPEDLAAFQSFDFAAKGKEHQIKLIYSSGLHPHEAKDFTPALADQITSLAQSAHSIGETGLDFYYDLSDHKIQKEAFAFHIELAKELNKPLVIHCRDSKEAIHDLLKVHGPLHEKAGILHCFTEDWEWAQKFMDLGLMISFSGILTFNRATDLREVAKKIPLDRLLIETDAPYLAPVPFRGKENQPSYVKNTFDVLSEIRTEEKEKLEEVLWENSCRIFNLQ